MRSIIRVLLMTVLLIVSASVVLGDVTGPQTLTEGGGERIPTAGAQTVTAIAGNITYVNLTSFSVTRTWQGYYGEVSGTIVLADASNYTIYDWNNANPDGRVYAARVNNVDWSTIACATLLELSDDEAQYTGTNITNRDNEGPIDRPNVTFVKSTAPGVSQYANYSTFWVGDIQINGTFNATGGNDTSQCFSTVMHNSTSTVDTSDQNAGNDINRFREVVLADGSGDGNIVYTAILEDNYLGFNQQTHDFQMIVGEDGHGTDTATDTYYFYIELE